MAIENRLFEAKDLKRILGLTPEKIFLWLRTYNIFEPTERAIGIRGKNKYSLVDLVKLGFIANLLTFGIHLAQIREIFIELDKVYNGKSLWEIIISEKRRLRRHGLILIIARVSADESNTKGDSGTRKPLKFEYIVDVATYADALDHLDETMKAAMPKLIVNIGWIVDEVEMFIKRGLGPQGKRVKRKNNAEENKGQRKR